MIVVTTHDSLEPIKGGGAIRTRKLASELAKRGVEVLIVAPSIKSRIDGLKVLNLPVLNNRASISAMLYYSFKFLYILVVNSKSISAVWAHNAASGSVAVFFGKIFGKKIVLDVTDIHSGYMKIEQSNFFKKKLIALIEEIEFSAFRNADKVIVATNYMKLVLQQKGVLEENIRVIYDGVDAEVFREKHNQKNSVPVIIHHGGMEKQDGVHLIIQAAKYLKTRGFRCRFVLAGGSFEKKKYYMKMALEYGVGDLVEFPDWMPFESLVELLRTSDIGIVSRTRNLPNDTVTTLKLFEYMSVGLIPVVPNLKGITEVCIDGENSLVFEADDATSLAKAILQAASSDECVSKISLNARSKAKEFDWERQINQIADETLNI